MNTLMVGQMEPTQLTTIPDIQRVEPVEPELTRLEERGQVFSMTKNNNDNFSEEEKKKWEI